MIVDVNSLWLLITVTLSVISQGVWCSIQFVTCGSSVKLVNVEHRVRLHSHDVKYGSGSGQQSVTAVSDVDDSNSYWQVLEPHKAQQQCKRGDPIKCGQNIRLLHINTKKYLHSHLFQAPMTDNYLEVSAYEQHRSDTGDNWIVMCTSEYWNRNDDIRLKHIDTNSYLATTGSVYGRPIKGQYEVAASKKDHRSCGWKTSEGVFLKPDTETNFYNDDADEDMDDEHDEL